MGYTSSSCIWLRLLLLDTQISTHKSRVMRSTGVCLSRVAPLPRPWNCKAEHMRKSPSVRHKCRWLEMCKGKEVNRKWICFQVLVTMITTCHTNVVLPSGTRATQCSSASTSVGKRRQVVMLQCDPKDRGRLLPVGRYSWFNVP